MGRYRMLTERNYTSNGTEFADIASEIEDALDLGINPLLSKHGSSGVYFMRGTDSELRGVFKPKDEEPYGNFNPRWLKWLQKMCFPCCFGRGCLVINQGYLSEAGASLVDRVFELGVVPPTKVMTLYSPTFNYGPIDRAKSRAKHDICLAAPKLARKFNRVGLPSKIGSLQLFVHDFVEADAWAKKYSYSSLSDYTKESFRLEFEKLVVLDYLIRNTDRGGDNWLVKLIPRGDSGDFDFKISAIDNGLAFPFKHPDEWRAYPYAWASWPTARIPFSSEMINHLLPKLESLTVIEELINDLREMFAIDKHFKMSFFNKQMGVFRGQVENLKRALTERKTPLELINLPAFEILPMDEVDHHFEWIHDIGDNARRKYTQLFLKKKPFFTVW